MTAPWSLDRLQAMVAPWMQPISADKPGGVSAKAEKGYEKVLSEVAKLDSPSGGVIDWRAVSDEGLTILAKKSKDFLITSYVAFALTKQSGLKGLLQGLALEWAMLANYWTMSFPEVTRLRGRANAIDWLATRIEVPLGAIKPTADDRENIEGIQYATGVIQDLVRERFGSSAPALGPLVEAIQRLAADLPPEPEPVPTAPPPPAQPSAGEARVEAPPPAPPPPPPPPVVIEVGPHILLPVAGARGPELLTFVHEVIGALSPVAKTLRAARVDDAFPYRLLRVGLWLSHERSPAADESGKTQLAPVPAAALEEISKLEASERWHDALSKSEAELEKHPFALVLQRHSVRAMTELGFREARNAVLAEVRALLTRWPELTAAKFSDGKPLADEQTFAWLESSQLVSSDNPRPDAPKPVAVIEEPIVLAQRAIAKGARKEAFVQSEAALKAAVSERERFSATLVQAQVCAMSDNIPLAKALLEGLDREMTERGLESWEPTLAIQVLRGILALPRQASDAADDARWASYQSRLFRLDARAALELKRR
ncbi:MAG: type VI secretion system protein TssA [Archangium sp.]|nr:type VI secretion system protein TssA [Archangium sp.]